ncbi:hypothetical protein M569_07406, partial [Genlisea aurea]
CNDFDDFICDDLNSSSPVPKHPLQPDGVAFDDNSSISACLVQDSGSTVALFLCCCSRFFHITKLDS